MQSFIQSFNYSFVHSFFHSIVFWLIDWLIDWMIFCLEDWLINWLVDWLNDWFSVWLYHSFDQFLNHLSILSFFESSNCSLTDRLNNRASCWWIDYFMHLSIRWSLFVHSSTNSSTRLFCGWLTDKWNNGLIDWSKKILIDWSNPHSLHHSNKFSSINHHIIHSFIHHFLHWVVQRKFDSWIEF